MTEYFTLHGKCPGGCGRRITDAFPRTPIPVPYIHRTIVNGALRTCRLCIIPDMHGEQHRVHKVPGRIRVEDYAKSLPRAA